VRRASRPMHWRGDVNQCRGETTHKETRTRDIRSIAIACAYKLFWYIYNELLYVIDCLQFRCGAITCIHYVPYLILFRRMPPMTYVVLPRCGTRSPHSTFHTCTQLVAIAMCVFTTYPRVQCTSSYTRSRRTAALTHVAHTVHFAIVRPRSLKQNMRPSSNSHVSCHEALTRDILVRPRGRMINCALSSERRVACVIALSHVGVVAAPIKTACFAD
jgi:hypothetical protein